MDENLTARFVVPVVMENVFAVFINMAISGVISSISASALAAISMANSIMSVVSALFSMVTTGSSVLIARQVGAGEYEDAAESIEQSTLMSLVTTITIMVLSILLATPLLRLLMPTAEAVLFGEAVRYFRMVMISLPLLILHGVFSGACRGLGNSRVPLLTTVMMSLSQLFFSWLCVSVIRLNEIGAGIAIIICRLVGVVILLIPLMKDRSRVVLRVRNMFLPKMAVCRRILRIGLPMTVESLFVQFGYMLAGSMAIALGTFASAVNSIVNTVYGFAGVTQGIFSTVSMSSTGHLLGRKDYKGVKTAGYLLFVIGVLISGFMALIGLVFGEWICGFYTSDSATLDACMKIMWVIIPLNIVANAVNTVIPQLKAGGDSTFVMFLSLLAVWGIRLPLTWLLCFRLDMGVLGLFLGNTISLAVRTALALVRFAGTKWMYRRV